MSARAIIRASVAAWLALVGVGFAAGLAARLLQQ